LLYHTIQSYLQHSFIISVDLSVVFVMSKYNDKSQENVSLKKLSTATRSFLITGVFVSIRTFLKASPRRINVIVFDIISFLI